MNTNYQPIARRFTKLLIVAALAVPHYSLG